MQRILHSLHLFIVGAFSEHPRATVGRPYSNIDRTFFAMKPQASLVYANVAPNALANPKI